MPRTAFYFIPSAMTGFIVSVFRFESASPLPRRSKGLSWVKGNLHAQF